MKSVVRAVLAAAIITIGLTMVTPTASADDYWDGYWSWYDGTYRPYYSRYYSYRPYSSRYYYDDYYASPSYSPYYGGYSTPYYGGYSGRYYGVPGVGGYYDRLGSGGGVQVGPLTFGWR